MGGARRGAVRGRGARAAKLTRRPDTGQTRLPQSQAGCTNNSHSATYIPSHPQPHRALPVHHQVSVLGVDDRPPTQKRRPRLPLTPSHSPTPPTNQPTNQSREKSLAESGSCWTTFYADNKIHFILTCVGIGCALITLLTCCCFCCATSPAKKSKVRRGGGGRGCDGPANLYRMVAACPAAGTASVPVDSCSRSRTTNQRRRASSSRATLATTPPPRATSEWPRVSFVTNVVSAHVDECHAACRVHQ
jgi:hypothetical protein